MTTQDFHMQSADKIPILTDLNLKLICKECRRDPPNIVERFSDGDLVCQDCGLVIGDRIIDTRSEWRTFADDDGDDPSRVGSAANPFLSGAQLDTIISSNDGGNGAARRLARLHGRSSANVGQMQILEAHAEIAAMCDHAGLSKAVTDAAKQLYADVVEARGKQTITKREVVIATCIYIGCRREKVGRTFKEISAITRVPKRDIGRCFKQLMAIVKENVKNTSPADLMARFCSRLNLSTRIGNACVRVTYEAEKLEALAGKSPVTIAAACIYMVSGMYGMPRSAKDIARVAGVSEVTIRSAYKSLYAAKEKLIAATGEGGSLAAIPTP